MPPEGVGEGGFQEVEVRSWKMQSFRLTTRKLPVKVARIAGSRMIGVKVRV